MPLVNRDRAARSSRLALACLLVSTALLSGCGDQGASQSDRGSAEVSEQSSGQRAAEQRVVPLAARAPIDVTL